MNLFENPVFLTQRRLAQRLGVIAPVIIAGLISGCLLIGLINSITTLHGENDSQNVGKGYYAWLLGLEMLVLVVGGLSRISQVLVNERKTGLWDSNRLTPLTPAQLIVGYWFGSPLREVYMGAVFAVTGLAIVLLAGLPLTFWLGTQALTFATALLAGLFAVLIGLTAERAQGGLLVVLLIPLGMAFSTFQPRGIVLNFLLPVYPTVNLFDLDGGNSQWAAAPEFFGLPLPPLLYTFLLQGIVGLFLWRAAIRKSANPFQPLFLRWEAIAFFGVLIAAQHGLIWTLWKGAYGDGGHEAVLPIVHGGTMVLGVVIAALTGSPPENVRLEALRRGGGNTAWLLSRSGVMTALILAAVAAAALFTHFMVSLGDQWQTYAVAAANLLALFTLFSLLFELCRLRFQRRAMGFFALGLFIVCVLPFILAAVSSTEFLVRLSFLSPGVGALIGPDKDDSLSWIAITAAHLVFVCVLAVVWRLQWKQFLDKSLPGAPPVLAAAGPGQH